MVEFWTSAARTPIRRVPEAAAQMESLGWTGMTTVDSQNLSTDPYVFLTLAATGSESTQWSLPVPTG